MNKWYFTFGSQGLHAYCYTVIKGHSYRYARHEMERVYGSDWSMDYSEDEWLVSKEKYDQRKNERTVGEWHEGYTQAELYGLKRI